MRYWSDKDANGTPLTDGRQCYVIASDLPSSDPAWEPPIYTYGRDREEVFEKLAHTTQTAQSQIHRMRKATPSQPPASARPAAGAAPAGGDLVTAVADLSNPAKAGAAVKTLLKSVGVDVDRQATLDAARRVADVAEKWELAHPDYPKDPRNDQILLNKAALLAGGALRITADHIEAAYEELTRREMFFEPKPERSGDGSTVHPDGNPDSRTVRNATSYRRNTLRSPEPRPAQRGDTAQEAKWRAILNGPGAAQEHALRHDPGYAEWVEKVTTKKSA